MVMLGKIHLILSIGLIIGHWSASASAGEENKNVEKESRPACCETCPGCNPSLVKTEVLLEAVRLRPRCGVGVGTTEGQRLMVEMKGDTIRGGEDEGVTLHIEGASPSKIDFKPGEMVRFGHLERSYRLTYVRMADDGQSVFLTLEREIPKD